MKLKNKEAKEIARNIIQDALSIAYYQLEGTAYNNYSEEEQILISKYIEKEATRILKLINRNYYTQ